MIAWHIIPPENRIDILMNVLISWKRDSRWVPVSTRSLR